MTLHDICIATTSRPQFLRVKKKKSQVIRWSGVTNLKVGMIDRWKQKDPGVSSKDPGVSSKYPKLIWPMLRRGTMPLKNCVFFGRPSWRQRNVRWFGSQGLWRTELILQLRKMKLFFYQHEGVCRERWLRENKVGDSLALKIFVTYKRRPMRRLVPPSNPLRVSIDIYQKHPFWDLRPLKRLLAENDHLGDGGWLHYFCWFITPMFGENCLVLFNWVETTA